MTDQCEPCPGCGGLFAPYDGPVHRYMIASPGCWHAFGVLLAAEYSDSALSKVHRLSVDSYAVQHPGDGSRQAIQSVGLHLARLLVQIGEGAPAADLDGLMRRFAARKATLERLTPPPAFTMTMANVLPDVGTPRHAETVTAWARSAWADWRDHHGTIRAWVAGI